MEQFLTAAAMVMVLTLSAEANAQQYAYPGQTLQSGISYRVKPNVEEGCSNMRTGPGTNYEIMTRIPAGMGEIKPIGNCMSPRDKSSMHPFCHVEWHGFQGWLSSTNIEPEE